MCCWRGRARAKVKGRKCTGAPKGVGCEDGNSQRHGGKSEQGPVRAASLWGTGSKWAFRAGEFHAWTGFPRKSSLATIWKASWRKAQLGGREPLGDCRRTWEEAVRSWAKKWPRWRTRRGLRRHGGGGNGRACWPGAGGGSRDGTTDNSQNASWPGRCGGPRGNASRWVPMTELAGGERKLTAYVPDVPRFKRRVIPQWAVGV